MRAIQIADETGPDTALELTELPAPDSPSSHMLSPGSGVLVEVHAAGVSFPELLQTRGQYQIKPPTPFVPGSEIAGIVREVSPGSGPGPGMGAGPGAGVGSGAGAGASVGSGAGASAGFEDRAGTAVAVGDRVAAFCALGGWAELAVAPLFLTFKLSDRLDFVQGAGLILNYHTAYFALVVRGRLQAGETVLVHGAGGGVGTATLQVAKGLGAKTIAVVSDDAKQRIAEKAGADHVLRADGPWKDQARELSDGGVEMVLDPVGGDRFTDSLRSLRETGRVVVVGFTGGSIPEVKVNRLLLGNTEVIGAGWGAYAMARPELCTEIDRALAPLIESGAVAPIVGSRHPLERAADGLHELDERRALGKVVLDVRPNGDPRATPDASSGEPADASSGVPADAMPGEPADVSSGVPADAMPGESADASSGVPADERST